MIDYWKKYLEREVKKGYNRNYILRRIKKYISSGCALCWNNCGCNLWSKP